MHADCIGIELPLSNYRLLQGISSLRGELETEPAQVEKVSVKLSVLVAEDNQVNQMVVRGLLNQIGIVPVFASDGREAVERICNGQQSFDLILMDCEMPEMDGFEATQKIRAWERLNQRNPIPIIALTAHILPEYTQKTTQVGMNGHLSKPVDKLALTALLQRYAQA
ncbi:MAG TPA: response regulator [Pseudomonadales bacterium]|nr:response regulator [Pseudomonadales bacterium]